MIIEAVILGLFLLMGIGILASAIESGLKANARVKWDIYQSELNVKMRGPR